MLAVDGTVFGAVLFGVVAVGVVVAAIWGLSGRDAYDQVGGDGLGSPPEGPGEDDRRDEEIRQMQAARRRLRDRRPQGSPLAAAPEAAEDPVLAEEIRQLTEARDARRRRRGQVPSDASERRGSGEPDGPR